MPFPTTDWPTSYDGAETRTDFVDTIFADDFGFQDDQIRKIQQWIGTTGKLLGEDVAGAGPSGAVSAEASGGTAFTIAARNNFTSGKLLSVGDAFDAAYVEMFNVEYDGVVGLTPVDPLPAAGTQGRVAYKGGASEGLYIDNGVTWDQAGGADANAIHINASGEIAGITAKAVPTISDYLVIEDAGAANAKKSITIGDLPAATPAAHDLAGAEHNSSTLAQVNAKISDATLDDASSTRDPNAHTLGGSAHSADTLANVNAKISDATLDDITGQRDASSLQNVDIDVALAPTDGQVLTYDGTGTQWTAASPAEGTSYLEMGENHTLTSAGGTPDSEDVGRAVFDASKHNSVTFRAVVNSVYATTGTSDVKLYDDGSLTTPGTPRLVTTFTNTDDTLTYEVFEQLLTIVSSGAGTNEILGTPRVYRVVVETTSTSGDTVRVSTVGFAAVGNGDVVTLSADMVQAIAMSLNA